MFDEVNRQLEEYFGKWRALIDARQDERNKEFFERLKPTAVGWKVADFDEYTRQLQEWRSACDTIVEKWINERWVAKLHLKDMSLNGGIEIIELIMRRSDSSDRLGFNNVDFLCMEETNAKAILGEEDDLEWSEEKNGISEWISIRFDGTEAKLRPWTVLDLAQEELRLISNRIRGEKFAILDREAGVVISDVE
jgi:hypothetical protein